MRLETIFQRVESVPVQNGRVLEQRKVLDLARRYEGIEDNLPERLHYQITQPSKTPGASRHVSLEERDALAVALAIINDRLRRDVRMPGLGGDAISAMLECASRLNTLSVQLNWRAE